MKRKRSPLSLILTTLLFCLASSCKDANKTILKTPNEEPSISIFNSETDSIYITKTKLFYNQFLQLKQTDTQNKLSAIILDSTLSNYRKIKNKKASLAYPIYKDTWEYYIDRFEHSKAIATIEEFIEISKTDTNGDQIKLLEAYSYLGSELTYSGQCDTAIEKSFKPFLTLLEKEVSKTNDPDEIAFLKTGEIATYVGYLDCANILGDGNLQKKILKKSEELIVERHDDIPWYNVYKSDLLGMMSTLYLSMGDLSKAKIFLELYEEFMEPQDIIDEILLGDRKMSFFSEIQDIKKFDREFEISKTNYKKALTIFPPNTEESLLAISNHYLAFERKALLLAKKDPLDKEIPKLYHKAMEMIALVPNDARMNPLNSYRGMISYYDTFPKKDNMLFFLEKYRDLAIDLEAVDDIRDTQIFYIERYLKERKYEEVDSLLNSHVETLNIEDIEKFLSNNDSEGTVLANEKTIVRLLKIATVLKEHSNTNEKDYFEKSNQFYLLTASLLNTLKQNQSFNIKEIEQLKNINNGILTTRTSSVNNDALIIKYLECNQSLELLQKNANNDINLLENNELKTLVNEREVVARKILGVTSKQLDSDEKSKAINHENYVKLLAVKDSLNEKIKRIYPNYVFYTVPDFDLPAYQSSLEENTMVLRFYLTTEQVFAYTITSDSVRYHNLGKRSVLKDLMHSFTAHIKTKQNIQKPIASLNEIFSPVFSILNDFENIKIIPQAELSYLPFETLFTDLSTNDRAYSYNSSLILENNKKPTEEAIYFATYVPKYIGQTVLEDSNPAFELVRSGNYELPDAFEEANYLSNLFNGSLFTDSLATKKHFVENVSKFSVVHLAMHAIIDTTTTENNPMLLFEGDKKEDYLSINEIYNLQLSSQLTTLSACNTAYGEIDPVEGVLSLSRAFQYAGSKSTVTSLWRVPDKETGIIMKNFYSYLKGGKPKHIALHKAKQDYLSEQTDPQLKHPYYWAGFILQGSSAPIVDSAQSITTIILILLSLTAVILIFWFYLTHPKRTKQE